MVNVGSTSPTMDVSGMGNHEMDLSGIGSRSLETLKKENGKNKFVKKALVAPAALVLAPIAVASTAAGKITQFIPVFGIPINHLLCIPVEANREVAKHTFSPFKKLGELAAESHHTSVDNSHRLLQTLDPKARALGELRKKARFEEEMNTANVSKMMAEYVELGGDLDTLYGMIEQERKRIQEESK